MKKIWLVLLALLASFGSAEARYVTLQPTLPTVLHAMKEMGCSAPWLSVILDGSDISESDLNSLPIGTKVYAPEVCDDSLLSQKDRRLTKQIFAREAALRQLKLMERELAEFRAEDIRLKREFDNLVKDLRAANKSLAEKVVEIGKLNTEFPKAYANAMRKGMWIGALVLALLFGLSLFVIWRFGGRRLTLVRV